jgi:ribosomal protein S5
MSEEGNGKDLEENDKGSSSDKFLEQVISYNISEVERPGGLKVRFKITVVTGKKAAALDARQAEAIRRLLEWTLQHRQETGSR